jgi:hypothetical protein
LKQLETRVPIPFFEVGDLKVFKVTIFEGTNMYSIWNVILRCHITHRPLQLPLCVSPSFQREKFHKKLQKIEEANDDEVEF